MSRHGLVVIDVQNGFISEYTSQCLPAIYELLVDERFDVIVATRFFNPEGSLYRSQIHWQRLTESPEIDLDPRVQEAADYILDKPSYSAGQNLLDIVRRENLDEVTVVGIDTDVCVLMNAALLFDNNISVSVDTRACATNGGPEAEKAAFRLLQRFIGRDFVLR